MIPFSKNRVILSSKGFYLMHSILIIILHVNFLINAVLDLCDLILAPLCILVESYIRLFGENK